MFSSYFDSTNLKPEATADDIRTLCQEAMDYEMAAVCIHPFRVAPASQMLKGSTVKSCTVIGFPLGAEKMKTKLYAARAALTDGADELDMVINIGMVKDKKFTAIEREIKKILELKNEYEFLLKVIVETALLEEFELVLLTEIISLAEADFIKTSTGFSTRGVSMHDIAIINAHKSKQLKIKASGGIRELDFALELINTGVHRIGSSNARFLIEEFRKRGGL